MSVDWFIQKFQNSESVNFKIENVTGAFEDLEYDERVISNTVWWDLACGPTFSMGEKYSTEIDCLCINRPCLEIEFLESIRRILEVKGMVLFSPDLEAPFIGNMETANDLPEDFVDSMGSPKLFTSAASFKDKV